MLNVLIVIGIGIAAPQPLPSDTPPALPVPVERLNDLKSREDIIAASRLQDGSQPPKGLDLPALDNTNEVLQYMLEHYPPELRDRSDFEMPWAWLFIDEQGRPADARIVKSSGKPAFDSLALAALRVARFTPARRNGNAVGLWTPFPIEGSYKALADRTSRKPAPPGDGPMFTPYTVKPMLLNRDEVSSALIRNYPPHLRDKLIGGTVLLWALIERTGEVKTTQIKTSSGNAQLDSAATAVARVMRFTPARNGDQLVDVWIQLPIVFKSNGSRKF